MTTPYIMRLPRTPARPVFVAGWAYDSGGLMPKFTHALAEAFIVEPSSALQCGLAECTRIAYPAIESLPLPWTQADENERQEREVA